MGQDLRIGNDHPVAWWHGVGKGRALHSVLGHTAGSYAAREYRAMLLGATRWALGLDGSGCRDAAAKTGQVR
jgi:type 1 glutamine amidotransferase